MRLTAFRVEMYKNVIDSSWINVLPLTTFIGKNEAGKTSILKALYKLNPFGKDAYSISSEWPRSQRGKRDPKHIVCKAKLSLDKEEISYLSSLLNKQYLGSLVEVSRNYSGDLFVGFEDIKFPEQVSEEDIREAVKATSFFSWPRLGSQVTPIFREAADALTTGLRVALQGTGDVESFQEEGLFAKAQLEGMVSSEGQSRSQERSFISVFGQELENMVTALRSLPTPADKAISYIKSSLPTFIYMDDYRAFSGTARLDDVAQRIKENRPTPEDRSLLSILELSGLEIFEEVQKALSANPEETEQRQFDLNDASAKLTKEIEGRWKQRRYQVEFRADGQQFITFVRNSDDQTLIKLEERSKGFQWFFSFDLLFMYESKGEFRNCVILLDEPGLHLHPDAQKDLLRRLEHYAQDNTLLYTTHLPFMIDLRHPDRIRVVSEAENGTVVNEDLISSQPEGRLTVQAALGMSGSSSYLLAQRNIVVEGVDDFWIISELSNLLIRSAEKGLDEDILITPAGGASEATYIATLMMGQKLEVLVVFDTDRAGQTEQDRLLKSWLALYQEPKVKMLSLGPAVKSAKTDFSIEDLFADEFYLDHVKEAYKKELSVHNMKLSLRGKDQLCKRVERAFESSGITFNKGRVAKLIRRNLSQMKSITDLPEETQSNARNLFEAISSAFAGKTIIE